MPRTLTSDQLTALASGQIFPAIFVEITFGDGLDSTGVPIPEIFYLWSGIGTKSFNGQNWMGIGSLLGITAVEDTARVEAKGIVLSLSGIDPVLLPDALNNIIQGFPVIVYLGLYDATGTTLIDDTPITMWSGMVDQPTVTMSATDALIEINCESRLLDMNVPVERRYTNQQIQSENVGDTGGAFITGLQEQNIDWGSVVNSPNV